MITQHTICTVMRVKNEAAYIGQAIESVIPLGGPIIVLDDGSDDATASIVSGFDAVTCLRQDDVSMDEGRDRTLLYREAIKTGAAWYFTLDGDEVLADPTAAHMLRAVEQCPDDVNVLGMWLAVMASEIDQPPKWYGPMQPEGAWRMDRLIRLRDADPDHEFTSGNKYNLHCGVTPTMRELKKQTLNTWIKYYGYETPERAARKAAFYEAHDENNYGNTRALLTRRAKLRGVAWNENTSDNGLGIAGTVTY